MGKDNTNRLYIAYGSNMNLTQMAWRCPGAEVVGKTILNGWRLTFQGRYNAAHANIVPDETARTPVLVWSISEEHEASLDRYEGVAGGYYRKHHMPVTVNGKTYRRALVYLMNPNPHGLPTKTYLLGIKDGYQAAGIDTKPLQEALLDAESRRRKEAWR